MSAIQVTGLSKAYGFYRIFEEMSFTITSGACFALFGPNGAGKTTLLRILATLQAPSGGQFTIFGQDGVAQKDSVRATLALYHEHWPFGEAAGADPRYRLPTESVACILAAFDRFPEARCPLVGARPLADVEATLRDLRAKSKPAVDAALQHDNWLMILNNHPDAKAPGGKKPANARTKPTFAAPTMFGAQ